MLLVSASVGGREGLHGGDDKVAENRAQSRRIAPAKPSEYFNRTQANIKVIIVAQRREDI